MKKLSYLVKDNDCLITVVENDNIVLDTIPKEIDTYILFGKLFETLSQLDKEKEITLYFNLEKIPFAFILTILKINVTSGSKIKIRIKDEETMSFLNDFINTSNEETVDFFYKTKASVKEETPKTACETKLNEKFKKLYDNLDSSDVKKELKSLNEFLKDSDEETIQEIKKVKEKFKIDSDVVKNLKDNEKFNDLLENNLIQELQKLDIELY